MKNVFKSVLIIAMLGGLSPSCRKEAQVAAPAGQGVSEPRELVLIRRDPHMDEPYVQTIDVTWWEEGKDAVVLFDGQIDLVYTIPYPWHGEDTIIYSYDGDYLWVRTRPGDTAVYLYFEESGYQCYQDDKRRLGDTSFSLPRWDEDHRAVWLKGSLEDTCLVYPPEDCWVQGRVVGFCQHRWGHMEIDNSSDIVCIGNLNMVDFDSLKLYPNVEAIGIECVGYVGSYVPVQLRNLRKIPKDIDLYVHCDIKNIDSRSLLRLKKNLKGLFAYVYPWAGKTLRRIGKMRNLRQLDIRYYCANDSKLRHLAKLKHLHTLTLTGIKISDQGLAHLSKIRPLRSLRLEEFQAYSLDDFLVVFSNILSNYSEKHNLKYFVYYLILSRSYDLISCLTPHTTAEGWQNFAERCVLEELKVYAELTDDDLRGIGQITSLRRLRVNGKDITDAGLEYLQGLTNLVYLYVYAEGSTEEGYKRLKQALPNCEIDWANRPYYNSSGLH